MCECLHKEGCWHYINKDLCGNKSWLLKKKKTEASSHFSGMKELLHSGLVGGKKYLLSFTDLKNQDLLKLVSYVS